MLKHRLTLCILVAALFSSVDALAAAGPGGGKADGQPTIRELLEKLRAAPTWKRHEVAREIADRGQEAIDPLIGEVAGFKTDSDTNCVVFCIIALGELKGAVKARKATDVLLQALRAPNPATRYAAAQSLGQVWKETDPADPKNAAVQKVNAALLARMFEGEPTLEKLAPALALIDINGIMLPSEAKNLSVPQLREEAQKWAAKKEAPLPPLEQQPWQLLLVRVRGGSQDAKKLLIRDKPLDAADEIVSIVKTQTFSPSIMADLADVLTGITGVSFPREIAPGSQAQVVEKWIKAWYGELCDRREPLYRQYVLNKFERVIERIKSNPQPSLQPSLLLEMERLKAVLGYQFDTPADIPDDASLEMQKILNELLGTKQLFIDGLNRIQKSERGTDKVDVLKKLSDHIDTPGRRRIAWLFVPQLLDLAAQEQNPMVLAEYMRLLTRITDVVLPLSEDMTPEKRKAVIAEWKKIIAPKQPDKIP